MTSMLAQYGCCAWSWSRSYMQCLLHAESLMPMSTRATMHKYTGARAAVPWHANARLQPDDVLSPCFLDTDMSC